MGEQQERHIEAADGCRIAVDLQGEADAPVVMLVHGLGFSRRAWREQSSVLIGAGYRVSSFDLRGFGGSDAPARGYDVETLAADLEAVRSDAGCQAVHLVGHSMGGMVALRYVLDRPERVRSLFLASTTSHNGRRAAAFARIMALLSQEGFEAAKADAPRWQKIEATIAEVIPFTGPIMGLLRSLTKEASPARARAWESIAEFTVKDRVAAIGCPTTVMHGSLDANIPFMAGKLVHEAIEGSAFVEVAEGRHNLPIEQPELFNEQLLAHLQRAK